MSKSSRARLTRDERWGAWEDRSRLLKHRQDLASDDIIVAAYTNRVLSVQWSQVQCKWGIIDHLWVRRHDEGPLTWRELQRVKDELAGVDRVGVEVYPSSRDLVDLAPMYHLWVFEYGFELPFGLHQTHLQEPTP